VPELIDRMETPQ